MRWAKELPKPSRELETHDVPEGNLLMPYDFYTRSLPSPSEIPKWKPIMLTHEALSDIINEELFPVEVIYRDVLGRRFPSAGQRVTLYFRAWRQPTTEVEVIILDRDCYRNMYMVARAGWWGNLLYLRRRAYRTVHEIYFNTLWRLHRAGLERHPEGTPPSLLHLTPLDWLRKKLAKIKG